MFLCKTNRGFFRRYPIIWLIWLLVVIIVIKNFNINKGLKDNNNIQTVFENNKELFVKRYDKTFSRLEVEFKRKIERVKSNISCDLIFEGNKQMINNAMREKQTGIVNENFIFSNQMCSSFRKIRGYDEHEVSKEELDMPLAFSILTYHNTEQFERLLKVIYRPHNIYCIHVDSKSSKTFHDSIYSIVKCFDNVFIASKLESIVYAGFSRLQADLNCMSDLLNSTYKLFDPTKRTVKWKYLFNLASTEFPLKTNYEIVKILKLYNGANDIEVIQRVYEPYVKYKWIVKNGSVVRTNIKNEAPPHSFSLAKGLAYGVFSYDFIYYTINNDYSKDLLQYVKNVYSPDEM